MNFFTLLLPLLLIAGLFAGLVLLKRHLFSDDQSPASVPIPDLPGDSQGPVERTPVPAAARPAQPAENDTLLSPSRLYPGRVLSAEHMSVFSSLLKALPGYVVLPKITYDQFLEARDGSPSENTSLQNRAAQHLADFLICNKKLYVLLVCQVEDGTQVPARIQEREKMLQKAGLRLLRWKIDQPPDPAKLLNTVQTLQKMKSQESKSREQA